MLMIRPTAIVLTLLCALSAPLGASAQPPRHAHPISPVVVERLALIHPHPGQRDTVYVRVVNGTTPVKGARLTAHLVVRGHVLGSVRGTTTDRHGQAYARFILPPTTAKQKLHVVVLLRYGTQVFTGTNICFPA